MLNEFMEIKKKIESFERIIILRHQKPDFDALGSQFAFAKILKLNYPQKEVLTYGADNLDEFSFIGENNKISAEIFKNSLLIILDTANLERLEVFSGFKITNYSTIKIDHHPDLEKYANLSYVEDIASSTGEVLFKMCVENLNFQINSEIARLLFIAIYGDTGGFSYPITSSYTFSVISKLTKFNFDFEKTVLQLKSLKLDKARILGWMYDNIEVKNKLGIIKIPKSMKLTSRNNISYLINFLGIIEELNIWVLMVEYDKFIRVNLRSKGDRNVSKIANQFNGGGHKNASGAKVYSWEEADKLLELLKSIN